MKKSVRVLIIILLILCVGAFLFAGYKLVSKQLEYRASEKTYDSLAEQFVKTGNKDKKEADGEDEIVLDPEISPVNVDFKQLQADYPDIVAWLYCPETAINYPVCQYDDNAYYLNRLPNGQYNSGGTLFVDCLNQKNFADPNTIIYGHHMNDGSMFAKLVDYAYQDYYDKHPVMYLNTPKYNYRIELFAGYVTSADALDTTYRISFTDDNEYNNVIDQIIAQSKFTSDVKPEPGDKILTLSTCTYEYDNARFVVQGKMVPIH